MEKSSSPEDIVYLTEDTVANLIVFHCSAARERSQPVARS